MDWLHGSRFYLNALDYPIPMEMPCFMLWRISREILAGMWSLVSKLMNSRNTNELVHILISVPYSWIELDENMS